LCISILSRFFLSFFHLFHSSCFPWFFCLCLFHYFFFSLSIIS